MSDEASDDHYRGPEPEVEQEEVERETFLSKVPEWVPVLGAGFLFTATLVSFVALLIVTYLLITQNYVGPLAPVEQFAPRLLLVEIQLLFGTGFQAAGVYLARRRTHWGTVLLSCLIGSLVFITLPFTVPAFILLGLGKYHFSLSTPLDSVRGE